MNVISFSLWGSNPLYTTGAMHNVNIANKHYPEWKCRFYVDDTVPDDILFSLTGLGADVVVMPRSINCKGSMWRFMVMFDETVERFVCRDTDARLSIREKLAVDEWVTSEKPMHVMRDHPHHATDGWAIFAGMFGGVVEHTKKFEQPFFDWYNKDVSFHRGCDQDFLHHNVWGYAKQNMLCHDTYRNTPNLTGEEVYFPMELEDNYHVGAIVDPNNSWEGVYE